MAYAMIYKQYVKRWKKQQYRFEVQLKAYLIRSDGCSGLAHLTQAYKDGCFEHDIHYATHKDFATGVPIEQEDADLMLKWYIQYHSWFGRASPIAWWRYKVLSQRGLNFGHNAWETGPARLQLRIASQPMLPLEGPGDLFP